MGVGLGQTEEFFHVIQKIPNLCLANDRDSEAIKRLAVDFGQTEEFFHGKRNVPSLCPEND